MHEYTLIKNLLESVERDLTAKGVPSSTRIREITVRVGALDIHSAEACRQAFAMLARGTRLEGSELKLTVLPARLNCPKCNHTDAIAEGEADGHAAEPWAECPQCGQVAAVTGGRGVEAVEVLLEE
jgi:Zn finger protein HypA/HybF involved in hydrogenase expression